MFAVFIACGLIKAIVSAVDEGAERLAIKAEYARHVARVDPMFDVLIKITDSEMNSMDPAVAAAFVKFAKRARVVGEAEKVAQAAAKSKEAA